MSTYRIWKKVEGFPDYEVSDDGKIRSWRRRSRTWRNPHPPVRDEPHEMTPHTNRLGYQQVMLRRAGNIKPVRRLVHRLVAIAFLPNPDGLSDVAHNDGNSKNSHVSNLRWASHRDNQMDMRKHGTMQDGAACITAKISEADAREIHRRAQVRGEGVKLAKEFGLGTAQISRIKNARRWRYLLSS